MKITSRFVGFRYLSSKHTEDIFLSVKFIQGDTLNVEPSLYWFTQAKLRNLHKHFESITFISLKICISCYEFTLPWHCLGPKEACGCSGIFVGSAVEAPVWLPQNKEHAGLSHSSRQTFQPGCSEAGQGEGSPTCSCESLGSLVFPDSISSYIQISSSTNSLIFY